MKVYCDLHIHTCLSPCADDDVTPWNAVGMGKIKGLDVIAITDHNSALNVRDAMAAGNEYGVAVIAGMEITSKEEAHILAYFERLDDALAAGDEVYAHLADVKNNPQLFGNQLIMQNGDELAGVVDKLLITSTDLSVDEVCELIARHHGLAVPAHINRGGNGMIGALGLMPFLPEYPVVEVVKHLPCPDYAIKGRFLLQSSDAHRLEDIQERVFALEVDVPTAKGVFDALKAKINI